MKDRFSEDFNKFKEKMLAKDGSSRVLFQLLLEAFAAGRESLWEQFADEKTAIENLLKEREQNNLRKDADNNKGEINENS